MASIPHPLSRRVLLEMLGDPSRRRSLGSLPATRIDLSSDAIERDLEAFRQPKRWRHHADRALPNWYSERTRGANFSGVSMPCAHFEHGKVWRADFSGANLRCGQLQYADLGVCDFDGADLTGADLTGATLSRASFRGATLHGARFCKADLRDADFTDAHFSRVYLAGVILGNTQISRGQLQGEVGEEREANYDDAISAYAALKANFRALGRFEDASWAYMEERRMETKALAPWRLKLNRPAPIQRAIHGLRWLGAALSGLLAGYGERPLRAVAWVPLIVLAYATVYWRLGDLTTDGSHPASFGPCLRHSLASFVTLSVAGTPAVYPWTSSAQALTSVEAMTGVSLLALIMFSLGKRITRS